MEQSLKARAVRGLGLVAKQRVDLVAYSMELFHDLAIGTRAGLSVSLGFEAFTDTVATTV